MRKSAKFGDYLDANKEYEKNNSKRNRRRMREVTERLSPRDRKRAVEHYAGMRFDEGENRARRMKDMKAKPWKRKGRG